MVSQHSSELSPIAVDAVLKVADSSKESASVNLKDIKIIKKLGGTIDDTELVEGLVLSEKAAGAVKRIEKAKIGLIQFQVSPPKTDNQVNDTKKKKKKKDVIRNCAMEEKKPIGF